MHSSPISLTVNSADFRLQALSSLLDTEFDSTSLFMAAISGVAPTASGLSIAQLSGLSKAGSSPGIAASGRNLALHDPESAYRMMTTINAKDVLYKAQFSELSRMQSAISKLQGAAQSLDIGLATA